MDPRSVSPALRWGMFAIAGTGVVLRARQYAVGRSLWVDEAMLGLAIREESLVDLVWRPLPRGQIAPAGFLILEKVVAVASTADQALRLVPFLASLGFLVLVAMYARNLTSPVAKLVLVATCSWSPVLVYYSSELKQYGVDVTVAMALLVAFAARERTNRWWLIATGAVALVVSHAGAIVLSGVAGAMLIEAARRDGLRDSLHRLKVHLLVWGVTGTVVLVQIGQASGHDRVEDFWSDAFAPAPTSKAGLEWWWESALGVVHLVWRLRGVAGEGRLDAWTEPANILAIVIAAGVIGLAAWRRRIELLAPAIIVTVALGLSALERYPFRGRVILFLAPVLLVAFAHGVDEVAQLDQRLAAAVGVVVVLPFGVAAIDTLIEPEDRFDIVEALERIENDIAVGDVIVVGSATQPAFDFYAGDFDLGAAVVRSHTNLDPEQILALGDGFPVWFVASHIIISRDREALDALDASPLVVDGWTGDGVIVRRLAHPPP